MIKTTGYELKKLFNDRTFWPDSIYIDELEVTINGTPNDDFDVMDLNDEDQVKILSGNLYESGEYVDEIESLLKRWRKKQSICSFVVECSHDKKSRIVSAIKAAGGKLA